MLSKCEIVQCRSGWEVGGNSRRFKLKPKLTNCCYQLCDSWCRRISTTRLDIVYGVRHVITLRCLINRKNNEGGNKTLNSAHYSLRLHNIATVNSNRSAEGPLRHSTRHAMGSVTILKVHIQIKIDTPATHDTETCEIELSFSSRCLCSDKMAITCTLIDLHLV